MVSEVYLQIYYIIYASQICNIQSIRFIIRWVIWELLIKRSMAEFRLLAKARDPWYISLWIMLFISFIIYTQYWIERSFHKQFCKRQVQGFVEQKPAFFRQSYLFFFFFFFAEWGFYKKPWGKGVMLWLTLLGRQKGMLMRILWAPQSIYNA